MAKHLESGSFGEALAVQYLKRLGYEILFQNWRFKRLEIDIIAKERGILVFVEVKSRKSDHYGLPYEFVDHAKEQRLIRAAEAFLADYSYEGDIRFDIVSVYLSTQKVELIRDAFWSN
ncbi:YraN family protein [Parapedobacter sp. SGR-10]|uniref:YraN family protein n=1 Tax=Parapedobacter sp. SGR-10 TaxID=2710879 RepID=UPI0013D25FB7|nr:YraN family protein [Parapedobacter sp. SGR-10]NGF55507.1 YraN family protein [Parapedobacter sp. SGR-10]